jgi:predicted RNA-binding protein with PUA-like domain
MNHWLFKSEPNVYSIDDLAKDKKTAWTGIRNFQARNFLKSCKKGDLVLIYHSNIGKCVVGVAKITAEAYPEIDKSRPGEWVQVDIGYVTKFSNPVTLDLIKSTPSLKALPLLKQSRLSCMPVGEKDFNTLIKMGEQKAEK